MEIREGRSLCGPTDGVRALFRPLSCAVVPPSVAPDLIYQFISLLPGESTQYRFFDPRYQLLAEIARSGGDTFCSGRKPRRGGPAVLAIIFDAEYLHAGDVTCWAIGGLLVTVEQEDTVNVEGERAHPLARIVWYQLVELPPGEDAEPDDPSLSPPDELRARILGQVGVVTDLAAMVRKSGPRYRSFWARSRSWLSATYWFRKTWGRGSGGSTRPFRPNR